MSLRGIFTAGVSFAVCGLAFAADPVEPAPFAADAFAQPIAATADTSSATVSDTGALRWKSKQVGTSQAIATSPTSTSSARGWNRTRIDGQVRPAGGTVADPFSDPFGDAAVRQVSDIELEPTEAEGNRPGASAANGVEELPAPAPRQLRPFNAPPATEVSGPEFTFQPTPGALDPGGLGTSPAPAAAEPCDRIYNDRNCCNLDASCKAFRNQLISDNIRKISLDITPRFDPSISADEDGTARENRLNSQDLFRTWRNYQGEVLATGRMSDIQSGRVIIHDESGKEVARLPLQELGDDEICWVNSYWRLPVECVLARSKLAPRNWLASSYQFTASALCHKPLYFEEVQLERYGHTAGPFRQPFISGAHFFLNIAALPYNMAINPPHECQYALGYYRPGSCAPWMIQPIPLSLRGAAAQTGAILGGVYLIP